ncbi:MAG: hypothetical protein AAF800_05475 [Planctomycetota bacterium]
MIAADVAAGRGGRRRPPRPVYSSACVRSQPDAHATPPGERWPTPRWWRAAGGGLILIYAAGFNGRWRITADSAGIVNQARRLRGEADALLAADPRTPPGLASCVAALGGTPGVATGLMMLGFAAAALVLTHRVLRVNHGPRLAAAATLLLATNRHFYETAFGLLTELPFTVGLLLLLWGHERRVGPRSDGRSAATAWGLIGLGVVWMLAFRSVGAVVVAGFGIAELIRMVATSPVKPGRGRGRALALAVGLVVAVAGGLLVPAVRLDAVILLNSLTEITPAGLWINLSQLMTESLPEAVFGQDVPPALAWPLSAGVVAGGLWLLRVRLLWGVLFVAFVAQWLVFLNDTRYVLPVLPVLLVGGGRLVWDATRRWPRGARLAARRTAVGLLVASNLVGIGFVVVEQRTGETFYAAYRSGKYAAAVELAEVLRRGSPTDAVLLADRPMWAELAALSRRAVIDRPTRFPADAERWWLRPYDGEPLRSPVGPAVAETRDLRSGEPWSLHRLGAAEAEPAEGLR